MSVLDCVFGVLVFSRFCVFRCSTCLCPWHACKFDAFAFLRAWHACVLACLRVSVLIIIITNLSIWVFFREQLQFTWQQGNMEAISITPLRHFHSLHRHLDISRAITAESSPLLIAISRNQTGNLSFTSSSHSPLSCSPLLCLLVLCPYVLICLTCLLCSNTLCTYMLLLLVSSFVLFTLHLKS